MLGCNDCYKELEQNLYKDQPIVDNVSEYIAQFMRSDKQYLYQSSIDYGNLLSYIFIE